MHTVVELFSWSITNRTMSKTLSRFWMPPAQTQGWITQSFCETRCELWTRWLRIMSRKVTARRTKTRSVSCSLRRHCSTPQPTGSSCTTRSVKSMRYTWFRGWSNSKKLPPPIAPYGKLWRLHYYMNIYARNLYLAERLICLIWVLDVLCCRTTCWGVLTSVCWREIKWSRLTLSSTLCWDR